MRVRMFQRPKQGVDGAPVAPVSQDGCEIGLGFQSKSSYQRLECTLVAELDQRLLGSAGYQVAVESCNQRIGSPLIAALP